MTSTVSSSSSIISSAARGHLIFCHNDGAGNSVHSRVLLSFPRDATMSAMSVTSSVRRGQQLHQLPCVSCEEGRGMWARGGGFSTCHNNPWVSEKSVGRLPRLCHRLRPLRKMNYWESLCVRCEKNPGLEFYYDDEAFTFQGDETWNANVAAEEGDVPPSTWSGAVLFRRSSIQRHYDLHTTLERLHLHRFSSELSRNLAHTMGINLSENQGTSTDNNDPSVETPVSISMDVMKKGKDLHLEGIVRTAISVPCNRCLSPVAERVLADFRLTLMPNPPQEPSAVSIGVLLDDDGKGRPFSNSGSSKEGDSGLPEGALDIDLDDKLHFPPEAKEMDLSSCVRDTIHLEMPLSIHCDTNCKGLCMQCGANLNLGPCKCITVSDDRPWGPLEQLKKQLED